jgi:transposase-like protein
LRSPFDDGPAAREFLEALRWPDGPACPRCGSCAPEVFRIGGEKRSHRDGLYQCKPCRRQFSVTVGTVLERLRVPLSTWVRGAYAFSYKSLSHGKRGRPPLTQLKTEIGVSYRTVLRMRDIIKRAAERYKGHRTGFGVWPRSFMKRSTSRPHDRRVKQKGLHPSPHTIRSAGVLVGLVRARTKTRGTFDRTEQLLRLLLATAKPTHRRDRP